MSPEARQFERIKAARDHHDATCPLGKAIEVHMNGFDIKRMQWDEGDTIAGLLLVANPQVQPDRFKIICPGDKQKMIEDAMAGGEISLPQPAIVEVPDVIPIEIITPERVLVPACEVER